MDDVKPVVGLLDRQTTSRDGDERPSVPVIRANNNKQISVRSILDGDDEQSMDNCTREQASGFDHSALPKIKATYSLVKLGPQKDETCDANDDKLSNSTSDEISKELVSEMIKNCPVPIKQCSVKLVDVIKGSTMLLESLEKEGIVAIDPFTKVEEQRPCETMMEVDSTCKDSEGMNSGKGNHEGEGEPENTQKRSSRKRKHNSMLTDNYLYNDADIMNFQKESKSTTKKLLPMFQCNLSKKFVSAIVGTDINDPKDKCTLLRHILPAELYIVINNSTMILDLKFPNFSPAYVERSPSSKSNRGKAKHSPVFKRRKMSDEEENSLNTDLEEQINEYLTVKLESIFDPTSPSNNVKMFFDAKMEILQNVMSTDRFSKFVRGSKRTPIFSNADVDKRYKRKKTSTCNKLYIGPESMEGKNLQISETSSKDVFGIHSKSQTRNESFPTESESNEQVSNIQQYGGHGQLEACRKEYSCLGVDCVNFPIKKEYPVTDNFVFEKSKLNGGKSVGNYLLLNRSIDGRMYQSIKAVPENTFIKQEPLYMETRDKESYNTTRSDSLNTNPTTVVPIWSTLTRTPNSLTNANKPVVKTCSETRTSNPQNNGSVTLKIGMKDKTPGVPSIKMSTKSNLEKDMVLNVKQEKMENEFASISSLVKRIQEKVLRELSSDFSNEPKTSRDTNPDKRVSNIAARHSIKVDVVCTKSKGKKSDLPVASVLPKYGSEHSCDVQYVQQSAVKDKHILPKLAEKLVKKSSTSTSSDSQPQCVPDKNVVSKIAGNEEAQNNSSSMPTTSPSVNSIDKQGNNMKKTKTSLAQGKERNVVCPPTKGKTTQENSNTQKHILPKSEQIKRNDSFNQALSGVLNKHAASSKTNTYYKFALDDKVVLIPVQNVSPKIAPKAIVIDTKRMPAGLTVGNSVHPSSKTTDNNLIQKSHTVPATTLSQPTNPNNDVPLLTPVCKVTNSILNPVNPQITNNNALCEFLNAYQIPNNVMSSSALLEPNKQHPSLLYNLLTQARLNNALSNSMTGVPSVPVVTQKCNTGVHNSVFSLTAQNTGLTNPQIALPLGLYPNKTVLSNASLSLSSGPVVSNSILSNTPLTFKSPGLNQSVECTLNPLQPLKPVCTEGIIVSSESVCIGVKTPHCSLPMASQTPNANTKLLNSSIVVAAQNAAKDTGLTNSQVAIPFVLHPNSNGLSDVSLVLPLGPAAQPIGLPNTSISSVQNSGFASTSISTVQKDGFPTTPISTAQNDGFPNISISTVQKDGFPNISISSVQNSGFSNSSISSAQNSELKNTLVSSAQNASISLPQIVKNHAIDKGSEGSNRTQQRLTSSHIPCVTASSNTVYVGIRDENNKPLFVPSILEGPKDVSCSSNRITNSARKMEKNPSEQTIDIPLNSSVMVNNETQPSNKGSLIARISGNGELKLIKQVSDDKYKTLKTQSDTLQPVTSTQRIGNTNKPVYNMHSVRKVDGNKKWSENANIPDFAVIDPELEIPDKKETACLSIDKPSVPGNIESNFQSKATVQQKHVKPESKSLLSCSNSHSYVPATPSQSTLRSSPEPHSKSNLPGSFVPHSQAMFPVPNSKSMLQVSLAPRFQSPTLTQSESLTVVPTADNTNAEPYPVPMFTNNMPSPKSECVLSREPIVSISRPMKSLLSNQVTNCTTNIHPMVDKIESDVTSKIQDTISGIKNEIESPRNETCKNDNSSTESDEESKLYTHDRTGAKKRVQKIKSETTIVLLQKQLRRQQREIAKLRQSLGEKKRKR